jgi:hypothetical protein
MVAHQHIGMDFPAGLGARLPQQLKKQMTISIADKDVFAPIAPIHDVIDCPLKFNAQLPRHGRQTLKAMIVCQ